ncbi:MAG: multicopper oxidase family protein [Kineosporiaceae bacterium]|nr:multicopper oxidase family protein [Kineosporiaceae bacterium]
MRRTGLSRRQVLRGIAGAAGLAAVSGCTREVPHGSAHAAAAPSALAGAVRAAEAARPTTGAVRTFSLVAQPAEVDLGGRIVSTWTYGGVLPGAPFRATAGDRVRIAVRNELPEPTSVHWHGLAIRNDMDGVPGLTTPEIGTGATSTYDFVVPDPGTHWFHPHHGLQLDRGLSAAFIIDDPGDPGDHDVEWVLLLDDWTDGVGRSPEQIYADLTGGTPTDGSAMRPDEADGMGGMAGMGHGGDAGMRGMADMSPDGDVTYPLYLINGRGPEAPEVLRARAGQRVRLRIVNAAADTIFTVALGGHRLTITHTDGFPVAPVTTSAVRIGMGERYDAVVTLEDGVFPLVAAPSGKQGTARALVTTGAGTPPPTSQLPPELSSRPLTAELLSATEDAALPAGDPDTELDLILAGTMHPYVWTINGTTYDRSAPLMIRPGQAGRIRIRNHSMMSHPVHLHGHTVQLGPAGGTGPRKDTLLMPPMGGADVALIADNPGRWMVHCHNAYHAEAGMMTRLDYQL